MNLQIKKVAWIRDDVPPGQPAPGYLDCCICNRKLHCNIEDKIVICPGCGKTYNGQGWILDLSA